MTDKKTTMENGDPDELVFFVNGVKVTEKCADPEVTLLQYLRTKLRLTGTKLGCAEGGCGACTVMVSKFNHQERTIQHFTVNACLAPVCSMHGLAVTTVEGIGSTKTRLHPVQERIAASHGSQCGFCTPGIVMSMYTLLRNNPQPSVTEMESAFEGNLCRCTGYRPIIDGFRTFTKEYGCGRGKDCCRNRSADGASSNCGNADEPEKLFDTSSFLPLDPSQEPIFPSELQMTPEYDNQSLVFVSERVTWYRPTKLEELLELKARHPEARLVIGNTEIGVEVKFKKQYYPVIVSVTHISELNAIQLVDTGVVFGGSVTLTRMKHTLKQLLTTKQEYETRVYAAIVEMLRWFAGHQIRNVAAIAGNIMTASPISDLNPLFMAAGCTLNVASRDGGLRRVRMDKDFFRGYRRTALNPDEVLVSVHIPFTKQEEYFFGYKQAQRREDDISIVNAGMKVTFKQGTNVVQNMAIAYGGMAPVTVLATQTMEMVQGRTWDDQLVTDVCESIAQEMKLAPGTPGGMESYRNTLTLSFFFKFYLTVLQRVHEEQNISKSVDKRSLSVTSGFDRKPSHAVQVWEEPHPDQGAEDLVGRNIRHLAAQKQATGEAVYCDDMPKYENELYLGLVLSTKAHAEIVSVDPTEALKVSGVHGYVDHQDIPGENVKGQHDETIFATDKVVCQGEPIGAIVANNQTIAQRAAAKVKVEYKELKPVITIEQAIAEKSFIGATKVLENGDVDASFARAAHVVTGEVRIGGQEHFYLETNVTIAVPHREDGEMEVYCSTQNPTELQMEAAAALGVPANRIVVRVKRMGGGFGGKESRYNTLALPVIVAAAKYNRPVRCMLDRDEDMVMTGTRHPFLGKYKVGVTSEGKFECLDVQLYSNAGNCSDLSHPVLERAMFHSDNTYKVPNVKITGNLCKTNTPSNTAFRGFGGPQGMMVCEAMVSDVAASLGLEEEKVREINMYVEGETTHFNQTLVDCNIRRCWEECIKNSDFEKRKEDISKFNREHRWKKRGISVVPTKFGISYTFLALNQAGALVHIYKDGSVLITHGGTEMGQGLHTKMIQVASRVLNIPLSKIHISETTTNTVPNTSATAASASSDLNGMAIKVACEILMDRLKPFMEKNPKGSWDEWVMAAYMSRVSLSTTGFYRTPGIGYNWDTMAGNPFAYFTFGAACSEVEIDCLTGDHKVLRSDIVMDIGTSLNPAIDIGQIEGGFMQGYGLFTLEEQRYSPDGFLYTRGPGTYKIPGFGDIPVEFNVSLLKGSQNKKAVYSSKAIGEPPLFLASSVFYAIKKAITAARSEVGLTGAFQFDSPATAERIRMACQDQFTKQFPEGKPGTFKPWFVRL